LSLPEKLSFSFVFFFYLSLLISLFVRKGSDKDLNEKKEEEE
jgi:hypothetical protein